MRTSNMTSKTLKIFFYAIDATGHMNACIGLGQALAQRGHQIIFLLNSTFKGQFKKFGFGEILLKLNLDEQSSPTDESVTKNPVIEMAKSLLDYGFLSGKSPLEKIVGGAKCEEEYAVYLCQTLIEYNPQIVQAIESEKPDLIVLDHFYVPPAVLTLKVPWICLSSGNPLMFLNEKKLPPPFSGFSASGDQSKWAEFRQSLYDNMYCYYEKHGQMLLDHFECQAKNPFNGTIYPKSNFLNIYGYPSELDYHDLVQLPDNYIRVDAFCRETSESFKLPEQFAARNADQQKLIYFSMGSLGSVDVQLMKRVVCTLSKTVHKIIVSKGPLADEYDLPDNCWGKANLPQTQILPLVDLVITHGGNNTVTETFSFGKPMIVLPLFTDQYDNAQRIQEKGYGIRLEPYSCREEELLGAIDKLLNDCRLKNRLEAARSRIAESNSKELACEKIEKFIKLL